jgi:hypothetical protein
MMHTAQASLMQKNILTEELSTKVTTKAPLIYIKVS